MKLVSVCACPAGLMHTFMAAKALKKAAATAGDEILVETQSASGIEGELSQADVDSADAVVLAIDTAIQGRERFGGKPVVEVGTSQVLRAGARVIEQAHAAAQG